MDKTYLDHFFRTAYEEDIRDGDHTSLSCIPPHQKGKVKLLVKEDGIIAGIDLAMYFLEKFDPEISIQPFLKDGQEVKKGDVAFVAEGKELKLLQAERLILNIMQRMSGIATETRNYTELIKGTKSKILDTRKTTPGFRYFEKLAVKIGGGENHRMGLFDMIMLKDNHIDFAGGIEKAIDSANNYLKENQLSLKIEVETRSLEDVKRVLNHGKVHRIMLDNFTVEDTRKAIERIQGKYETESSGGITKKTIRAYAECGVDYISVGALTHQVKSLDLSLKAF